MPAGGPPLPLPDAANFNAEVAARAAQLPTVWCPMSRKLERVVDPTRQRPAAAGGGYFFFVVLLVLLALAVRSFLAPSVHGGHHGHQRYYGR